MPCLWEKFWNLQILPTFISPPSTCIYVIHGILVNNVYIVVQSLCKWCIFSHTLKERKISLTVYIAQLSFWKIKEVDLYEKWLYIASVFSFVWHFDIRLHFWNEFAEHLCESLMCFCYIGTETERVIITQMKET